MTLVPGSAAAIGRAGSLSSPRQGEAKQAPHVSLPVTVASLSAGVSDATTDRQVMLLMMRQLTLLESKIDRLQCEVDAQRKQIAFQHGKADVDSKILVASFVSLFVYF
jgi:hypothetical protein